MASHFDLDQLQAFVAIAETGSFTRAAETVFKTQSAISMQMKRLEERVGYPLFIREGRGIRMTHHGERLLDYARRILALNAEALAAVTDTSLDGHIRLGTPDEFADRFLPEILTRFARTHPRVEVTVICEPTPILAERIARHDLDLALITHVESRRPAEVVRREPLHWIASPRSSAHTCDVLPLALGRPSCDWRIVAESALTEMGRPFRVLYSSWHSTAVAAAVTAGLAVSVLPESAIRPDMRILGAREGFPALPSCKIALLRDYDRESRLASSLADHITSSLDNQTSPLAAE